MRSHVLIAALHSGVKFLPQPFGVTDTLMQAWYALQACGSHNCFFLKQSASHSYLGTVQGFGLQSAGFFFGFFSADTDKAARGPLSSSGQHMFSQSGGSNGSGATPCQPGCIMPTPGSVQIIFPSALTLIGPTAS